MLSYTVKRKNIKNIILKITYNGRIEISAPMKTSEKVIKGFVFSKLKWIEKHISLAETKKEKYKIDTDKSIYLLGEKILMSNDQLIDEVERSNFIKELYKIRSSELINPLIEKFSNVTGLEVKHVTYRFMKTRWGSCNSRKKYLNINTLLVASPLDAIEYIILHEIAHLKYPNHQREFWDFVNSFMPDWEIRKEKLIYFEL